MYINTYKIYIYIYMMCIYIYDDMCSQEPLMMAVKSSGKAALSPTTQRSLN